MKLKIFTIYDSKATAYLQPFFMATTGQAIRAFTDATNDSKTQFYAHPEDFTLFEVGLYDDTTARSTNLGTIKSLGTALELKDPS